MITRSEKILLVGDEPPSATSSNSRFRDAVEAVEASSAEVARLHLESIIHGAIQKQGRPLVSMILRNVVFAVFVTIGIYGVLYQSIMFGFFKYEPGLDTTFASMCAHGIIAFLGVGVLALISRGPMIDRAG